jgi:hypothetical protein
VLHHGVEVLAASLREGLGRILWMVDEVHVGFMCFGKIPGGFSLLEGYNTCK